MTAVGLLKDRRVNPTADRGSDPCAAIVDDLSADRAGRQPASHDRANVIQPRLDRPVIIAAMKALASIIADVLGDHDFAVIPADDTGAARQLDQNGRHERILAPLTRPHLTTRRSLNVLADTKAIGTDIVWT